MQHRSTQDKWDNQTIYKCSPFGCGKYVISCCLIRHMLVACSLIHLSCHQHRWNNLYLLFFLHSSSHTLMCTVCSDCCLKRSSASPHPFLIHGVFYSHGKQSSLLRHHATWFELSSIVNVPVWGCPPSLLTLSTAFLFCRTLIFKYYFDNNFNKTTKKTFPIRLNSWNSITR